MDHHLTEPDDDVNERRRQVMKLIENEQVLFDMGVWLRQEEWAEPEYVAPYAAVTQLRTRPVRCDTVACLAGTAVIAYPEMVTDESTGWSDVAEKILGIHEQNFYIDRWPAKYKDMLYDLEVELDDKKAAQARVAVQILQDHIDGVNPDR